MAGNPIHFQPGLSLPAFLAQYGTEAQCQEALFQHHWPEGFVCPDCGNNSGFRLSPGLYQCHRCHHQTSLTAGTIFHGMPLPLTTWFQAIYLLTQRKSGISSLQPSRELGVSYNTAWQLKPKILQVMHGRNQGEKLSRRIELDDAYLGDERPGKRGRGAERKFSFVAALQMDEEGHPQCDQLCRVCGFTLAETRHYAQQAIASGSQVINGGLGCFRAFYTLFYVHDYHITGEGRAGAKNPEYNWVNTLLGNVKNAITGTYHAIRGQHAPRYLAEFKYRFNRRYDLKAMIPRFLTMAARTPPMPYRFLKMSDSYA